MANSTGFSPTVTRYLNSLKGSKRQELVNQIAQLSPQDLENLEMRLQQKFEEEQPTQQRPQLSKQAYMDLNEMDENQYQKQFGGYQLSNQRYNPMSYFQDGGTAQQQAALANYGGDDSADYLMQVQNQQQVPVRQVAQAPQVSPYGVVMTPEMQAPMQVAQPVAINNNVPVGGARLVDPNSWTYDQAKSAVQQGIANPSNLNNYTGTATGGQVTHNDGVVINNKAANDVNRANSQTVKQAEKIVAEKDGVKAIQRELIKRGYDIKEDGIFGKNTKAAVQKLQSELGLEADGIVGSKTKVKLGLTDLGTTIYRSNIDKVVDKAKEMGIPVQVTAKANVITPKAVADPVNASDIGKDANYYRNINKERGITKERFISDNSYFKDGYTDDFSKVQDLGNFEVMQKKGYNNYLFRNKKTGKYSDFPTEAPTYPNGAPKNLSAVESNPAKTKQFASAADFGNRGFYDMPKEQQQEMTEYANIIVGSMIPIGEALGIGKVALKGLSPKLVTSLAKYSDDVVAYASKIGKKGIAAMKEGVSEAKYLENVIEAAKSASRKTKDLMMRGEAVAEKVGDKLTPVKDYFKNLTPTEKGAWGAVGGASAFLTAKQLNKK